jgi:hypothetical protein
MHMFAVALTQAADAVVQQPDTPDLWCALVSLMQHC